MGGVNSKLKGLLRVLGRRAWTHRGYMSTCPRIHPSMVLRSESVGSPGARVSVLVRAALHGAVRGEAGTGDARRRRHRKPRASGFQRRRGQVRGLDLVAHAGTGMAEARRRGPVRPDPGGQPAVLSRRQESSSGVSWTRRRRAIMKDFLLTLRRLFRMIAPMRSRDNMRAVMEGIDPMEAEETAYWPDMAMH